MLEPWYDMKTSMSKAIGETMLYWSEHNEGYPAGMTDEEWTSTLRKHGQVLYNYGTDQEELEEQAQTAMYWIAANFSMLWD